MNTFYYTLLNARQWYTVGEIQSLIKQKFKQEIPAKTLLKSLADSVYIHLHYEHSAVVGGADYVVINGKTKRFCKPCYQPQRITPDDPVNALFDALQELDEITLSNEPKSLEITLKRLNGEIAITYFDGVVNLPRDCFSEVNLLLSADDVIHLPENANYCPLDLVQHPEKSTLSVVPDFLALVQSQEPMRIAIEDLRILSDYLLLDYLAQFEAVVQTDINAQKTSKQNEKIDTKPKKQKPKSRIQTAKAIKNFHRQTVVNSVILTAQHNPQAGVTTLLNAVKARLIKDGLSEQCFFDNRTYENDLKAKGVAFPKCSGVKNRKIDVFIELAE